MTNTSSVQELAQKSTFPDPHYSVQPTRAGTTGSVYACAETREIITPREINTGCKNGNCESRIPNTRNDDLPCGNLQLYDKPDLPLLKKLLHYRQR